MRGAPVEDSDVAAALSALPALRALNLNGCKKLSPAVVPMLVAHMVPSGATPAQKMGSGNVRMGSNAKRL